MANNLSISINPKSIEEIKKIFSVLTSDEVPIAQARGINKTMDGVRTDGVKILSQHYALTATEIRNSWKIHKAAFRNPNGVVSSAGTFVRLKNFGAKQVNEGVSVKVLKTDGRKIVPHAFLAKMRSDQKTEQVYRRKWRDNNPGAKTMGKQNMSMARKGLVFSTRQKRWIPAKWMDNYYQQTGEFRYRLPVRALFGPRLQDYLADTERMTQLMAQAGKRLIKDMQHEVDYLISQAKAKL